MKSAGRALLLLSSVLLMSCEGDADKLNRLRTDAAIAATRERAAEHHLDSLASRMVDSLIAAGILDPFIADGDLDGKLMFLQQLITGPPAPIRAAIAQRDSARERRALAQRELDRVNR